MHSIAFLPILLFLVACQTRQDAPNAAPETGPAISQSASNPPPFLGVWGQEGLLQRLILEENGLCYFEEFILEEEGRNEEDPYRHCYGVWRQLENQIELAVYCTPESDEVQVTTRFTYQAQKDELLNPDGDAFSHLTTIKERIDLPPPRDIIDYFIRLPAEFITFFSSRDDYYFNGNKNFLSVIDRQNGYIADERRQFEAALFRHADGRYLLIVSNRQDSGMRSTEYDTYFLTYDARSNTWMNVREQVLPALPPALFFQDPEVRKLLEQSPSNAIDYTNRFEPPRRGTDLRVRLEINQSRYREPVTARVLAAKQQPVVLKWDRATGRFGLE